MASSATQPDGRSAALPDLAALSRPSFPALARQDVHGVRIFADNSSASQLPQQAIDAILAQYTNWHAHKGVDPRIDFGRASHIGQMLAAARQAAATLCGGTPEQIGFTTNASTALSLFAEQLHRRFLKPGDTVVINEADHDSNRMPWQRLEAHGIQIIDVPSDPMGVIRLEDYARALERRPKLVAMGLASNVTGAIQPYPKLIADAQAAGAITVIDAVQGPPHGLLDVMTHGADVAVFSNCKMFSPHLGWWAFRPGTLERLGFSPARGSHPELELGTQPFGAIAGLLGTYDYFAALGAKLEPSLEDPHERVRAFMAALRSWEKHLAARFQERLSRIPGVQILGPADPEQRIPIFAFVMEGDPWEAFREEMLSRNIEARTGSYRCPVLLRRIAGEHGGKSMRVSFVHYNSLEELDEVGQAVAAVARSVR